ncbi:putative periplasmic iron-binding protein [Gloeomargarita lithophora Alchichica-D10]|uniref:Putative periplasmic iron-binding protein n=1 Tax=Gloeomargarita lithophora Alchichica-D10 TaxID=1188229 RepID=A0A1J0A9D8_9CYAN|nr:metal ABC transporter substrate-binding protein [Gloeomargarita lithophora]APB32548.1 putative periplasmic iron-binding protein [Gloeomargarita lithophora Alchichica-D10]
MIMKSRGVKMGMRGWWVLGALLGLWGCQGNPTPPQAQEKVVLTTFTVLADMTRQVAGEKVRVESITKPGAEIHGYEPTPMDITRAQNANLILENGLGLERWAERFYTNLRNVPQVTLSKGITPIPIQEGSYKNQPNPHAWMSPQLALIYIENIHQALVNLDPENEAIYTQNAQKYQQEIQQLDQKLRQSLSVIPASQRVLVSCEGAFSYLTQDYNLKEIYLWPINAEQEGTPQQIRNTIDQVRASQVPVVFCESTVNDQAQKQVAKEAGVTFGGVFYVDSLTPATGAAPTYLQLLEHNVNTLTQGLQQNKRS